jgi:hypothetical protein
LQQKIGPGIYNVGSLRDNLAATAKVENMAQAKNKQEVRLQELIGTAKAMNLQVRTEKLLREAGYRVHSGRCRIKGQQLILIDRDASIADQIEFLAAELTGLQSPLVPSTAPDLNQDGSPS